MRIARALLALMFVAPSAEAVPDRARDTRVRPSNVAQRGAQTRDAAATSGTATNSDGGASQSSSALTADQVANRIQAFYDRTTDYEADFSQVSINRLSHQRQERQGHVRFKKPGKMRWDYTNPAGDVIVSDGRTIWLYEAAARQVIQSNIQQSQLPSALSFLTGTGTLAANFTFSLRNEPSYSGYVLELRPIVANPSFERIVFYVDRASFQVTRSVVFDAQRNTNTFDFRTPSVNMNHPDALFTWVPPAGVTVVRP